MALIGRLDLTVADLLQILSLSMKTGKLRLSRLGENGEIGFKNGKVIYATSNSMRNTLGEILIMQKHLTENGLMAALEVQHLSTQSKRLGAILVEKGVITQAALQEAIQYQIELVILEFLHWDTGFFRFETAEMLTDDDIMLDAHDFLVKAGIDPEHLLLEGMRRQDERQRATKPTPSSREVAPRPTADLRGRIRRDERQEPQQHAPSTSKATPTPVPERPPVSRLRVAPEAETRAASIPQATPPPASDLPRPGWLKEARAAEKHAASPAEAPSPPSANPDQPLPGRLDKGGAAEKRAASMPEAPRPAVPDQPPAGWKKEKHEGGKPSPSMPEATPPPVSDLPRPGWLKEARAAEKHAASPAEAPSPPSANPDQPLPGRLDKGGAAEKRAASMPEAPPAPPPDLVAPDWLEEELVADGRTSGRPEAPSPPTPDPDLVAMDWLEEALEDAKRESSMPQATPPPAPDLRGKALEGARPTPSMPKAASPPADDLSSASWLDGAPEEGPVPADRPASRTIPGVPQPEIPASSIVDHLLTGLPIAPWVPIILSAPDIVGRGVVLFAQEGRIRGYDQFGVYGGIEGGDARVRNINIPLSEGSIFAGVLNRGKTYRGKMGPGKWNAYFLEQIGGKKPHEAVLIPIIVAGKAVGIFYGDDAGSGEPLEGVDQLEALITETFSAIEIRILEPQGKHPA